VYGDRGRGFIHIHHITSLSKFHDKHKVDPVADLRPVCPNCHAMIHRTREDVSINSIKILLNKLPQ
jgi:5-methylcytosine-specific restriction protein A